MKTGTAGLELEITMAFHADGTPSGMCAIAAEGVALPDHLASSLWRYLRDMKCADKLLEDAAWDSEQEADDGACDEARISKGAA